MKKINLFKKITIVLLALVAFVGTIYSTNTNSVTADGETEYLKKGDGSYLTYRGSSEKVLTLKEYNNPIQQYRAVWVSHFAGDLSSYFDEESYKAELTEILENMESWGMNALVFHIRTHNNAMYDSDLNPRARWWQMVDFDQFDPLEWLIDECHKRGIEFHAWMNPYRVLDSNVVGEYPEGNPALDESLLLSNGSGTILDPGSQVVRDFIVATCMEVIEKYDVDAIHFDDYFYISGVETSKSGNWKRQQVDLFIEQLHNEMKAHNEKYGKNVQLGISPSGIYRNGGYVAKPTYDANGNLTSPLGSYTAGFAHYDDYLYSDTLHWINEGWIDYITPQSYWGLEHNVASYAALTRWWSWATTYKDCNLYMGMGIYMAIESSGYWNKDTNEVKKQLLNAGMYSEIDGICVYKYASLLSSNTTVQKGVATFKELWGGKRVPSSVQKSYASIVPSYPVENLCLIDNEIVWDAVDNVRGYMVYKVPTGDTLDKNNIDHLVEYTQDTSIKVNDTAVYDYYVSTVNRANVIGEPVKLSTGSSQAAHEVVFNRINALPASITLQHETQVNNILKLYNNLTAEEKALVTNYSILAKALNTINNIKTLEVNVNNFVATLNKDLENGKPLETPENMRWNYKNATDATVYNITTGEKYGMYLNKKITLTLTATVPNTNISHSVDVTFNASVIPSDYLALFYRNDASCMNPSDTGAYSPTDSKYIGWSNQILYVGGYALPIATGNYHEITSSSSIKKVYWTSCGGLYVNKGSSSLTFTPNDLFESESPAYGYFIIGTNNKLKVVSDTTNYSSSITLLPNEAVFVTRYLDRTIDGTPFDALTSNFNTSTTAFIEEVKESSNTSLVDSVILVIDQLPSNITLSDEQAVNEAKDFYNSLNDTEKALVTNYAKLESAIKKIEALKEEKLELENKIELALKEINSYVNLDNYSTVNQSSIKGYLQIAKNSLELAQTKEDVDAAVKKFKDSIDALKTIEEELVQAKEDAKKEIKEYVSLDNYSEKMQAEVKAILATADSRLEAPETFDDLNKEISKLKTELSNVMTLSQELVYLKGIYRDEIYTYYNESDYPSPSANTIAERAIKLSLEINKAETIQELEQMIADFKTYIENFLTLSELATFIENEKASLRGKVEDKYISDERVVNLITNYEEKINNVLTKSEAKAVQDSFDTEYTLLRATIDAENVPSYPKPNPEPTPDNGCKAFSSSLVAILSAASLAVLIFRKKR